MDIDLTIEAVEAIRDELSRLDPDGADHYRERADAYIAELRELDGEIREQLAGLPEERRYLVTFHDAYGYFADRYGLTILGFVVEGPEEEPSAAAITELVESIEELGIPPTSSANRSSAHASSSRSLATRAQRSARFLPGHSPRSIRPTSSSSAPSPTASPSEDAAPASEVNLMGHRDHTAIRGRVVAVAQGKPPGLLGSHGPCRWRQPEPHREGFASAGPGRPARARGRRPQHN